MAYLRLYKGDSLQKQWKVDSDQTTIGRAEGNDIVLPSHGVSKHHASIIKEGHSMVVIDHQSANGVYVNGEQVQRHKLEYWDDIQIFDYVIKYMAAARLPGEQQGTDLDLNTEMRDASTREFHIADSSDLAYLRRDHRVPHVTDQSTDPYKPIPLENAHFNIGNSKSCDIRLKGWFKPKVAARIQKRSNGYYLLRTGRGKILVNDKPVKLETALKDDDNLLIHGRHLKFYNRVL